MQQEPVKLISSINHALAILQNKTLDEIELEEKQPDGQEKG